MHLDGSHQASLSSSRLRTAGSSRVWPIWSPRLTRRLIATSSAISPARSTAFFWNEFCDWYIEFSKSRLSDAADPADRLACQRNLVFVLDQALRLLHPIMPFITEEIYQEMPVKTGGDMLIGAEWPDAEALAVYRDEASERAIELVCEVVGAIRSSRARYGISPKTALPVAVKAASHDGASLLNLRLCARLRTWRI